MDRQLYDLVLPEKNGFEVGVSTVFLPPENILFLAEWVSYYYELGVTRFFLYDNRDVLLPSGIPDSKSAYAKNIFLKSRHLTNKRGLPFRNSLKLSESEINDTMMYIKTLFPPGVVNYIKWSPRNKNNETIYGQCEAIIDAGSRFGKKYVDWMMNIDMDEYLYIKQKNLFGFIKYNLPCDLIRMGWILLGYSRFDVCQHGYCVENIYRSSVIGEDDKKKYIYSCFSDFKFKRYKVHNIECEPNTIKKSRGMILHLRGIGRELMNEKLPKNCCRIRDFIRDDITKKIKERLKDNIGSESWIHSVFDFENFKKEKEIWLRDDDSIFEYLNVEKTNQDINNYG